MNRWLTSVLLGLTLLFLILATESRPAAVAQTGDPVQRVNILPFDNSEGWSQTSIFWFGQAEQGLPARNYVDVRTGYTPSNLLLRVTVIDHYLWYKTNPGPADDLTLYDAVAVYLDTGAAVGTASPQTDDYLFFVGAHNSTDWSPYQRDARGSGGGWDSGWEGAWRSPTGFDYSTGGPNNNGGSVDFGWTTRIIIPWEDLGLTGPPGEGTRWGIGLQLYDRDAQPPAGGVPVEKWPASLDPDAPSTWAELHFGYDAYSPGPAVPQGSTLIRAQTPTDNRVEDAWMGGGGLCAGGRNGGAEVNHGADSNLFTGSEIREVHFPCYNKSYLRFALDEVPDGKMIVAASLTLHLFGHAGETPDLAQPSWVSLFTVRAPWQEMAIHWNNAPLPYENIDAIWVNPYSGDRNNPVWPGDPYTWDATKAVAEAYAAGQPVSLALYSSDEAEHSSKYYSASETGSASPTDPLAPARPTLTVTWGGTVAAVQKAASYLAPTSGETLRYTVLVVGSGESLTLTDDLPAGVSAPFNMSQGLNYSGGQLTWSGNPSVQEVVPLTYDVTVTAPAGALLTNTATLRQGGAVTDTAAVHVMVDPLLSYLPLVTAP